MTAPTDEEMIAAAYTLIEWCENKGCDECPIGMHGSMSCDRLQEPTVQDMLYELVDEITNESRVARGRFWDEFEAAINAAFNKALEERK